MAGTNRTGRAVATSTSAHLSEQQAAALSALTSVSSKTSETVRKAEAAGHAPRVAHGSEQRRGTSRAGGRKPTHGSGEEVMIKQRVAPPRATADTILLTFKEAMDFLRVSRSTLYRLMWSGQLRGHKVGSTWRFYESDLLAAVASPTMTTADMEPGPSSEGRD